ncbi:MAG: hypothetical protein JWL61_2646 [Gemmatimonadetes bacterium]|nr:hypothetical protein [Gemmatimonadota bacterium]
MLRCLSGIGLLLAVGGCTFDQQVIAVATPQIVVHAVLDPNASIQEVLLERTLTGTISVPDNIRYDPLDPINSGDGIPVTGASVRIQGPDGTTFVGLERKYPGRAVNYGAGRYEVIAGIGSTPIRPGGRYTLAVRATDGTVVTGSTVVPNSPAYSGGQPITSFDRDRDSVKLNWTPVAGARTYGLRVESPFGAFQIFSDTTKLALPGSLRNFFASDLQRVFIPGFQQTVTLYAVDTNYFDYYRSRNDPFTGSGIINRLNGGIGLFGSVVTLNIRTLDVTQQPKDASLEGNYELAQAPPGPQRIVDIFRLYVETAGPPTSLSGWYSRDRFQLPRDGIAGTRDGTRIELQFLLDQDSRRRLATFVGVQQGDSLIGSYTGQGGVVIFRHRR